MKFAKNLVKFGEAKALIEKAAERVKKGEKELAGPLKENVAMLKMFKASGTLTDDTMIPLMVEVTETPAEMNAAILGELAQIKKSIEALSTPEKLAKADMDRAYYLLDSLVWRLRERLAKAQVALDALEEARISEALGEAGMKNVDDLKKLLDFDEAVKEAGSATAEVVAKMFKADEGDTSGDAGGDPPADGGDEGKPPAEGEKPGEGKPADQTPSDEGAEGGDNGGEGGEGDEEGEGEEDEDEEKSLNDMDLSPPLPPREDLPGLKR